jgi:putative membrane protein
MVDMVAAGKSDLEPSIDKAVKLYSSLFLLPSLRRAVLLLALLCLGGGILSVVAFFNLIEGLVKGLILGVSLFSTSLVLDYVTAKVLLRRNPIYDFRRTVAISLFCWFIWLIFIVVGVLCAFALGAQLWLIKLCLFGFYVVLIFRLIVVNTTLPAGYTRRFTVSFLYPYLCMALFMVLWANSRYVTLWWFLPFLLLSPIISTSIVYVFLSTINSVGKQMLGVPSITFLKAFLLNWVADLNVPFENLLEKLSEEQEIKVSIIKFDSSKQKVAIIVPMVHPGPFKNIGSSLLPSMLKDAFEKSFGGVACVPLGLLGHELDLASQLQNQKIIREVVESASFKATEAKATPFVKVSDGFATACCQVFGKTAFLSFTLAPKTTEDLPQELGQFMRQEAEKHGLSCVVVNAHNSIDDTVNMQEFLDNLESVGAKCLEKAISLKRSPVKVGAAAIVPNEFSLKDGMGLGGITAIVTEVEGAKTVYVVVDGNNMQSGLREKILLALRSIGFDEGEILTTDTHAVSAIVLKGRGYHPVGEAMDHEKLIGYIKEAALLAAENLEGCKTGSRFITVENVKVIGKSKLESLVLMLDRSFQKAKKVSVPVFALGGILFMLLLAVF